VFIYIEFTINFACNCSLDFTSTLGHKTLGMTTRRRLTPAFSSDVISMPSVCVILILTSAVVTIMAGDNAFRLSRDELVEMAPATTRTATMWVASAPGTLVSMLDPFVGQHCETLSVTVEGEPGRLNAVDLFAVLANGDLVITGDLSSVVDTSDGDEDPDVNVLIACRLGLLTWTELVRVRVVGRGRMTQPDAILSPPGISFRQPAYEGRIAENRATEAVIDGLESIKVHVAINGFELNDSSVAAAVDCWQRHGERRTPQGDISRDQMRTVTTTKTSSKHHSVKSVNGSLLSFHPAAVDEETSIAEGLSVAEHRSYFNVEQKAKPIVICYSITSGPVGVFRLVANGDGTVSLRTLVALDYERQSQYLLTVRAEPEPEVDNESSEEVNENAAALAHVRVFVDNVNDNAPQLDVGEYHIRFDVDRNAIQALPISSTAYDLDGDLLTFTLGDFENGDYCGKRLFDIDPSNGTIFVRPEVVDEHLLDYFRQCRFRLFADDGQHLSDPAVVTVDFDRSKHSRAPAVATPVERGRRDVRPLRQVEVPENMIGEVLDLDDGDGSAGVMSGLSRHQHEFYAFKEPAPAQLELNALTGKIKVRPGERLDYETQPEINFIVVVTRIDDASGEFIKFSDFNFCQRLHKDIVLVHSFVAVDLVVTNNVSV
jgi:hypothetical protein